MRAFWRHQHRRRYPHTPSCASPLTGAPVTPITFWWCKCGKEIDSELTPVGHQLVSWGYTKSEIASMASGAYWRGESHDSDLPLPPYRPGGPFATIGYSDCRPINPGRFA